VSSGTSTANCPTGTFTTAADNGGSPATRYDITVAVAPNQATVKFGAAIRFAREVRYSAYQAGDNQWYVGYQTCTPSGVVGTAGTCGTREVLAGPILPATTDTTTSGFFFVYYDKDGNRITSATSASSIARISVG